MNFDALGGLLIVAAIIAVVMWTRRNNRALLEDIDRHCGLGLEPAPHGVARTGEIDGCQVMMTARSSERGKVLVRVNIDLGARLPISVAPEPGRLRQAVRGRDLQLGCAEFDGLARIEGAELALRALLFRDIRDALTPFLQDAGRFDGQQLSVWWQQHGGVVGEQARHAVDAARALNRAAAALDDPVGHVAQVAARDPYAEVRAATLGFMIRELADEPRTAATVQAALSDPDTSVRRVAAVHLLHAETLEGLLRADVPADDQQAAVGALLRCPDGLDRVQRHLSLLMPSARALAVKALEADGRGARGGLALAADAPGELSLAEPER